MPAPLSMTMSELAKTQFRTFAIKLPTDWKQPQGRPAGEQYPRAFQANERAAVPTPMPPALFLPASMNKYHVDTANKLTQQYGDFIDGICSAICSAWSTWQTAATLVGVQVNAVTAAGGQVVGPPLATSIIGSGPKQTPSLMRYTNAVANAIGNGWLAYTATIKVPGLPWYPAFAAFPGPVTPPTPNVPVPVAALTQVTTPISKMMLKQSMIGLLGDPMALHHQELFDSIADAFEKCFLAWQTSTQVTNVLAFGPVPTFAPPFVPAGPVVGGQGAMTPGGFV